MKTLRRNDRVNTDRGELKLIRVGHAVWAIMKRDRARNGEYLPQSDPIWETTVSHGRRTFLDVARGVSIYNARRARLSKPEIRAVLR
jgi:hypothetical protein